MLHELDVLVPRKALEGRREHELGEVEANPQHGGAVMPEQCQ